MTKLDWDKQRRAPVPPISAREPLPGTFDPDAVLFEHEVNGWKLRMLREVDGSVSVIRWDHADGRWVKAERNQAAAILTAYVSERA